MTERNETNSPRQSAADGAFKLCRTCETAFSDAFPRVDCLCGKNDDGAKGPAPAPQPLDYAADHFGYDFSGPPAARPGPQAAKPGSQDDPFAWWL